MNHIKSILSSGVICLLLSSCTQDAGYNRENSRVVAENNSIDAESKPSSTENSEETPNPSLPNVPSTNPDNSSNNQDTAAPFKLPLLPEGNRIRDTFQPFFDEESKILADLLRVEAERRERVPDTRYITFTFLDYLDLSDQQKISMKSDIINSVSALLNSISTNNVISLPINIDEEWSAFRIDISDYKINNAEWNFLVNNYPYRNNFNSQEADIAAKIGTTQIPIVRGDWFANEILNANKYAQILGLPGNILNLENNLGVSRVANIESAILDQDDRRVSRVGIGIGADKSKKSINNRVLERHEASRGSYWISYDFANQAGNIRRNIFTAPIGPAPFIADQENTPSFAPDGHEAIFTLDNGLMGFYLANGNGNIIGQANTAVISNPNDFRNAGVIQLGYSCFSCHGGGLLFTAKDQLRSFIEDSDDRIIPDEVIDGVLAMHKPQDKLDQLINSDSQNFINSYKRTYLTEGSTQGIMQAVNYYEDNLSLDEVASELNITLPQLENYLDRLSDELQILLIGAKNGGLDRETFEANFSRIILELFRLQQG